jgi:hypothetical protein
MSGLAICFPVVFGVLLLATGNVIVSVYAIISIAFIVGGVLGAAKLYSGTHTHNKHTHTHTHTLTHTHTGWSLGVAESIAGVIVVVSKFSKVLYLVSFILNVLGH